MTRNLVVTEEAFMAMKENLLKADVIAFDTETRTLHDFIVGYSLCGFVGESYYIPVRHKDANQLQPEFVAPHIQEILRAKPNVGHHTKYDLACCLREGFSYVPTYDTMLEVHLTGNSIPSLMRSTGEDVDEGGGGGLGLKDLVWDRFQYKMRELIPDLFPNKKAVSFDLLPTDVAAAYSGDDADYTLRLHNLIFPQLTCHSLYKVEMSIVLIEVAMEFQGIAMNKEYMCSEGERLMQEAETLRKNLCDYVGGKLGYIIDFDPGNSHQCADILFDKLQIPVQKRSPKTKKPSTADDALGKIREKFPVVNSVLSYREILKASRDFYGKLVALLDEQNRVHTTYGLTTSGRFSSTKPNVQNSAKSKTWYITPLYADGQLQKYRAEILASFGVQDYTLATDLCALLPDYGVKELGEYAGRSWIINRHGDLAYKIETVPRKSYIPSPGLVLYEADYDQIESKILAAEAGEMSLLAQFMRFEDVHKIVAASALGIPVDKVTKQQRDIGKSINHAIPYGMSEYGLAARVGRPADECAAMLEAYFKARPAVRNYIDRTREKAEISRKVVTRFGRRQVVPEFYAADDPQLDPKVNPKADPKLKKSLIGKARRASVNRIIQTCYTGGSLAYTSKGLIPVSDLVGKHFSIWDGIGFIPAWGLKTHLASLLRVELQDRSRLDCVYEQPILCLDAAGQLEWRRADALREGDLVCQNREAVYTGDWLGAIDEVELLGRMFADGQWGYTSMPFLMFHPQKELEDRNYYADVATKLGYAVQFKMLASKSRLQSGRQPLPILSFDAKWKKRLKDLGCDHKERRIPVCILQGPATVRIAFLKGYFSGDGGWQGGVISVVAANREELLRDIQQVLNSLGVPSTLSDYKYKGKATWRLRVGDARKFMGLIGFRQEYKKRAVRQSATERLPKQITRLIKMELKEKDLFSRKYLTDSQYVMLSRGSIGYGQAEQLCTKFAVGAGLLGYRYLPVRSITSRPKEQTYDVATVGEHNRITINGFIVHNTSADITKIAMVRADAILKRDFKGKMIRMIMTNHDSLCWEVDPTQVTDQEVINMILEAMCFPIKNYPPITVTIKKGDNWGIMKEVWSKEQWLKSDLLQKLVMASGLHIPDTASATKVVAPVTPVASSEAPKQADVKPLTLILKSRDGVTLAQGAQLKKLLIDNPGVHTIELDGLRLDKFKTCLDLSSRLKFEAILPCQVSVSKQDIDVGALLK